MFDQFKERLHHVQQDLSIGLKTLSTKAKEVKRSRRDELAALKKDTFQQMWSELHKEIEASAEQARVVDSHVQELFLNYERRAEPLLRLQKQLVDLPRFVENIQFLTASVGKLEAEFEEVESMMLGYEDLIGYCDLLRNKHTQTAELTRYTQQKHKEEGLMRVRLQEEYEQSVHFKEESQKADKIERQKAFQDVFVADMQHYKTHGEMQRVVSSEAPRASTDISSIENFQISINIQEQDALDDFLGAPPNSMDIREEEADEDADDDDDDDDEDEDEDGEMEFLDVIDEESERDETAEDGQAEEDRAATEKTAEAEEPTSQERHQDDGPVHNGQHDQDDDDDDDEFDTPEEGSETENN